MFRKNILRFLYPILLAGFVLSLINHSHRAIHTSSKINVNKTVVIDAGHGFPDAGATANDGIEEKKLNLQIAKRLKSILEKNGFEVIMTRENDMSLSKSKTNNKSEDLSKRIKIRDNANADLFISIHMNHFTESKYFGAQVFYNSNSEESAHLANSIQQNLIEIADPSNTRSAKSDNNIFVLKNAQKPAVLVECGFLSNEEESKKLSDKKYQSKIAHSIYCGITEYLKDKN